MIIVEINISEGKNQNLIMEFERTLKDCGVQIIDINSDSSHNRSVLTFMGKPDLLINALKDISKLAINNINMEEHYGDHPRLGAIDVVAFIPQVAEEMPKAIELANSYGEILADMEIPVYLYERNARIPERTSLPNIRSGEYEGLKEKLESGIFNPDLGPNKFNSKSGASIVGARMPLIAFNINLDTDKLEIGKDIANKIRFSSGGLANVRAIALEIENPKAIQVSMNLTNYKETSIYLVYETIKKYTNEYNVEILNSEIIGHIPEDALISVLEDSIKVKNLDKNQIY